MNYFCSNFRRSLWLLIAACSLRFSLSAQIIYVTPSGAGTQSGSTWGNAAPGSQLQSKINGAANGTQIWVAAGTYKPTLAPTGCSGCSGSRDLSFSLRNSISIYGGFAGGEVVLSQRNISAHPTILSGDIGTPGDNSDNVHHVVISAGNNNTAVIDGFTIRDANTNEAGAVSISGSTCSRLEGGGIVVLSSSPSIANCIIANNTSQYCAGIENKYSSSPVIRNCVIVFNTASTNGGGIGNINASPNFINCTISANTATYGLPAMYNYQSSPSLSNCIVWGNGGIYNDNSSMNVSHSIIQGGGYTTNGNLDVDPFFVDASDPDGADNIYGTADDGLRLQIGSLAIDAGSNAALSSGNGTDVISNARIQGDTVDMGAYEGGSCPVSNQLYVDKSVSVSGNGSSWSSAYKELRDALAIAGQCPGVDRIFVATGIYTPTGEASRDSAFAILRGGLKLYGGYPNGGGTRDVMLNQTILSGDIGISNNSTDNSYHVMVIAGLGGSADSVIVDGFTIRGGKADGSSIKTYNGALVLQGEGSGLYLHSNNGLGGKIAVRNCLFTANTAASYGGALYNQLSSPTIQNCVFAGNTALSNGGGGMFNYNSSSPSVTNCVFASNAGYSGGGVYNYTSSSPLITNCTFSGNVCASSGAGIYNDNGAAPQLNNCIVWGNTGPYPGIYNTGGGSAIVKYSIVQGLTGGTGNLSADPAFANAADPDGTDNTFGTADDGLRLANCSPAINTGAGAAIPAGNTKDVTGAPRVVFTNPDMGAYEKQTVAPASPANGAALSGASANSAPFIRTCDDGTWTYYAIPNNADSIGFAIAWGGNTAAKDAATVSVTTEAANTAQSNAAAGTWAMRRYWNVALNGATISSPVNVRFYYAAADTLAMKQAAAASGLSPVSRVKWIKTNGTAYSPSLITPTSISSPFVILTPSAGGVENNTAWVQFNGITSFSGGTAMVNAGASIALPVTLLNFSAQKANGDHAAVLSWQVGTEHRVARYEVEYATDGAGFKAVGGLQATGRSSYAFIHDNPSGESYYRLKMLDDDGTSQYSAVVRLVFGSSQRVQVMPNPVCSELRITNSNAALNGTPALIIDMSGSVVTQFVLRGEQAIHASCWAPGLYLLRLADGTVTRFQKL